MNSRRHNLVVRSLFVVVLVALATAATFAQALNSNTATVTLNATLNESLTVAATPSNVNFTLVSGSTATGSAPVAMTTSWILKNSRTTVSLIGYFSSASAALSDGATTPTNIPTSEVLGQVTTGTPTSFTAFTQTAALGPAGAGLTLFTQSISGTNRAASRNDNLNLEINLTSQPQLPAGTYTGTLNLQAQAL
jgi:hypothetical protein